MRNGAKLILVIFGCALICVWMVGEFYLDRDITEIDILEIEIDEGFGVLEWEDYQSINLLMIINDHATLEQTVTLLKSILYYQGRIDWNRESCYLTRTFTSTRPVCESVNLESYDRLALYWFITELIWDSVIQTFEDWDLQDVQLNIYRIEDNEDYIKELGFDAITNNLEYLKLLLTAVPLMDIEKVIILDSNILFNDNVENLWFQFEQFNLNQFIGFACDQTEQCVGGCSDGSSRATFGLVNTGLMMLRLDRVLQTDWRDTLLTTIDILTSAEGDIPSVQKIFKTMITLNEDSFYNLPCEWNIQLESTASSNASECCPTYWVNRTPDEGECVNFVEDDANYGMAHTVQLKPGLPQVLQQEYVVDSLQYQFNQTYNSFHSMPLDCFI